MMMPTLITTKGNRDDDAEADEIIRNCGGDEHYEARGDHAANYQYMTILIVATVITQMLIIITKVMTTLMIISHARTPVVHYELICQLGHVFTTRSQKL
jgi:hypothetical protein